MKINKKILIKVELKEKEKAYINRCVKAKLCPVCGADLESRELPVFSQSYFDYKCTSCKWEEVIKY